jgi:hypothetical protein
VLVLLLAAYWRIIGLESQSLWNDEGSSYSLIQRDISGLLEAVRADIHPPGYYLILKGWVGLVGQSELGLRSLSVGWGMLAVAGTYALGARLYARAAGILAAALVALSPLAVYYSQEARMYAQLAALSVLSLWLLCLWLIPGPQGRPIRRGRLGIWMGLALVNALGLYTHYTYPFTMLVQALLLGLWLLQAPRRSALETLVWFIALNLLMLALFAPWLPDAYRQVTTWPSDDPGAPFSQKVSQIAATITLGDYRLPPSTGDLLWLGLLLLATLLPDWYPQPPKHAWRIALPLLWIGLISTAVMFSGAYREANLKFLLPAQLGVALLLGRSAYLLWDVGSNSPATPLEVLPRFVAALAFVMVLTSHYDHLTYTRQNSAFHRDDYRAIVQRIESLARPDDAVLLNGPGQIDVFNYYFQSDLALYPLPRGLGGDDAATQAETLLILEQHPYIWAVLWGEGERDPRGIVKRTLDQQAFEIRSQWFGDVRLVEYGVLALPPDAPMTRLTARFGPSIVLLGYSRQAQLTPQGGLLGVTLYWQTEAPLTERYKVFVQVLNAAGQVVGQHDGEPANGRLMTPQWAVGQTVLDNHGVVVQSPLTGELQLIVGLYPLDRPQERLPVNQTDYLVLERVTLP